MSITAGLVQAIESTWTAIQQHHEDVPDVVVTLGAGSLHKTGVVLGHFAPNRWITGEETIHELFVGGEGLQLGALNVLATLLHEAAHAAAAARGVKDTSRQGRYHNERFKSIGQEFGLELSHTKQLGWSDTALPETTATGYAGQVAQLDAAMIAYRRGEGTGTLTGTSSGESSDNDAEGDTEAPGKPKNGYAPVCECRRKIRVSASTYEAGPILCGLCGTAFTIQESA